MDPIRYYWQSRASSFVADLISVDKNAFGPEQAFRFLISSTVSSMKAVVVNADHTVSVQDKPDPVIGPKDVVRFFPRQV